MPKSIEQIDNAIAQLKMERKKAVARNKALDAEGARIAAMKIGEAVLSFYPGGWRTVDTESLFSFLGANAGRYKPIENPLPVEAALKEWKSLNVQDASKHANPHVIVSDNTSAVAGTTAYTAGDDALRDI